MLLARRDFCLAVQLLQQIDGCYCCKVHSTEMLCYWLEVVCACALGEIFVLALFFHPNELGCI